LKIAGRSSFAPRAGKDFDAILMEVADKFEKSDNKGKFFPSNETFCATAIDAI
jgi:hypothetical protein